MTPHKDIPLSELAQYKFQAWYVVVDPSKATDIFRPQYWVNATKFKVNDIIRVVASDKSFDFLITVTGKPEVGGGYVVDMWPRYPQALQHAVPADAAALSDAADVVKRELVASTVNGKPVPRVEQVGVDGWRVIGLDGTVHSKNHRSESAANLAMSNMLRKLGITEPAPEKATAKSAA